MKDAPAGAGQIVYAPDAGRISDQVRGNATVAPGKFNGDEEFEDNSGRRVTAANHIPKPWDPSGGTDPQKFEGGDGTLDEDSSMEEQSEEELENPLGQPEDTG
jgi:hypothetical protein